MGNDYGVSAAHPLAVDIGMKIMEKGGNAVDAAIAVAFALGVVEPYGSGIGGGGNMFIYPADGRNPVVYDYRETAPLDLDKELNVGVPGFIKGMEEIAADYGKLDFKDLIYPAIEKAKNGFTVTKQLSQQLKKVESKLKDINYLYKNGVPLKENDLLIQKDLANTLKAISEHGSDYFYQGEFADKLINLNIGITSEDLKQYKVKKRVPVKGRYGKVDVYSAPAPAGGITIIQILKLAELLKVDIHQPLSPEYIIGISKALRKTYELRISSIGDPDFDKINAEEFISDHFIKKLADFIKKESDHSPFHLKEVNNTTHFSVIDSQGMVVSTTNTLSTFFGSRICIDGVFLNNQMQNFGEGVNSYKVGKRCHSVVAPTILCKHGRPFMAIGAAGAATIPTMITSTIIKYLKHNFTLEEALAEARFFISKNQVMLEKEMNKSFCNKLSAAGLKPIFLSDPYFYGGVHVLALENNKIVGAADPRRGGTWRSKTTQLS